MFKGSPVFEITDKDVKVYIPLCADDETIVGYEESLILTREVFIECYNRWIKGESEEKK